MEIKVLGTVAPYVKDSKNCPGYLVKTKNKKILLDCGNGSTRLLNMEQDLKDLIIIISHSDPDHFGDLLSLAPTVDLYHKFGFLDHKVKLYVPKPTIISKEERYPNRKWYPEEEWGKDKNKKFPSVEDELIRDIASKHYFEIIEYGNFDRLFIDNTIISFSKTIHPKNTYAVKIQDDENTFVYSADTGYDENKLVQFAKNADIALFESTFLKGQLRLSNTHLYAYEAAKIARVAKVGQLVLTHFWPEIDKEEYVKEAKKYFENTIAAEEGMILRKELKHGTR